MDMMNDAVITNFFTAASVQISVSSPARLDISRTTIYNDLQLGASLDCTPRRRVTPLVRQVPSR